MSKSKKEVKKKKKCKELKAKLKKLRIAWKNAEKSEAVAERKYQKEYKKFKELVKASKDKWRTAKVESNKRRKTYLKAQKQLEQDCLPTPATKAGVWKEAKEEEIPTKSKTVKLKKAAKAKVKVDKKVSKKKTKKSTPKSSFSTVWGADKKSIPTQNGQNITVKAVEPKTPTKPTASEKAGVKDNLKRIEGIGPKIESLLQAAGIYTFEQLSKSQEGRLREILLAEGPRYRIHNPATWPKQASFAAKGDWEELKKWQEELKGGREV